MLFQSNGFDLGIFDQVAYLMSRGDVPFSTINDTHHMADHAAWSFYPVGLLYWLYPSVYWLFAIQAFSLSIAVWPLWHLARMSGLPRSQSLGIAFTYLLYPVTFNVNLFDFHVEVMAVPAMFAAILAAKRDRPGLFTLATLFVLGCKAVLTLPIAVMGIWLFVFEGKRRCGAIAFLSSSAWFVLATQVIVPAFKDGDRHAAIGRYSYLGDSIPDILQNLMTQPGLITGRVFSLASLEYLALLLLPVIWGLSLRKLAPLLPTVPIVLLNILSTVPAQRNLVQQYSLPILPFLLMAVMDGLQVGRRQRLGVRAMSILGAITFLALAKYGYFGSLYLRQLDNWTEAREAIALVEPQASVLTTSALAPHLTHRTTIRFTEEGNPPQTVDDFDVVLLNTRHPGWASSSAYANRLRRRLQSTPDFEQLYAQNDVFLFQRPQSVLND
ncbi:MAG: DUF2079 domain-containing protein [Cyanobacteria bacterium P01_E01_bin.45]